MRLIDADSLLETIEDHVTTVSCCPTADWSRGKTQMKKQVIEDICNAPTAFCWTNVKDGLPKKKDSYLVYHIDGTIWTYWYDPSANEWFNPFGFRVENVTHWMPLPTPPTN